ncbi:MAG: hypothetical protein JSW48_12485 [Betaproteobacteria bacterium]|jgi:hypothetical protein|nr:MAG: hypothetical protein JSW48_12485 [Betaproteobacteria bacterium]
MLTRSAILMIATFFALSGSLAHAKVSPALETQGQDRDQMLQQLINLPQGSGSCEVGDQRGFEGIETLGAGVTLASKLEDACPIPAPSPDPFENVAYL